MVANAGFAAFARHAAALVVLIANQVDLSIRACARPTPNAGAEVVLQDDVFARRRPNRRRRAFHLAERALRLGSKALSLNAADAADALAHVALVANLIDSAVRAGAHATPDSDGRAHIPIGHIPRRIPRSG